MFLLERLIIRLEGKGNFCKSMLQRLRVMKCSILRKDNFLGVARYVLNDISVSGKPVKLSSG